MVLQPPLNIPLLWNRVFHGLQVFTCSTVELLEQGHSCCTMFIMGCRGISALTPGAALSTSASLTLGACRSVAQIFSLVSSLAAAACCTFWIFPSLLCYPGGTATILVDSALAGGTSRVGSWLCLSQTWQKLLVDSQRNFPSFPKVSLWLPCCQNLATQTQ